MTNILEPLSKYWFEVTAVSVLLHDTVSVALVRERESVSWNVKGFKGFDWKKHNAGLNMRHKHGNQTITAALEVQSNTP